jgi:hypothetical protein
VALGASQLCVTHHTVTGLTGPDRVASDRRQPDRTNNHRPDLGRQTGPEAVERRIERDKQVMRVTYLANKVCTTLRSLLIGHLRLPIYNSQNMNC